MNIYYNAHKEKMDAQSKEWQRKHGKEYYHKKRLKLINFLGNKCIKCGETDWRCLQIDHVNGGGVNEFKKIGASGVYKRVLQYPEDYQLLCANCNWKKRFENNENPKKVQLNKTK